MTALLPWIAVIVTIVAGWALLKRYSTHMVLLFSGLVILICVALAGVDFLPKGVKTSGFWLFDIFATLKSIATKQSAGTGFLIMTAGGFAAYMDRIGAAKALVDVAVKPLSLLKAPYLVLAGGYVVGQLLVTVIPSAAGLAMLLLVALFPILTAVGTSPAAAAAVIGTSAGMTFAPTAGTASLAAKVAGLDPIIYLVEYQLPLAVPTLIVCAVAHYFVQRYYDKKADDVYAEAAEVKKSEAPEVPKWYALFPVLPIFLLIIFSKLVVSSVKLDTIAALFMVWVFVVIIEIIRNRGNVKKIFKDALALFQSMGKMFTGIVALIICAEFFATGLRESGLIDGRGRRHGLHDGDPHGDRLDRDLPHGFGRGRLLVLRRPGAGRRLGSRRLGRSPRDADAVRLRHASRHEPGRGRHHRGGGRRGCFPDGHRSPHLDPDDPRSYHDDRRQSDPFRLMSRSD